MKSNDKLIKEFGARACTLNTGATGIRAGLHTTCRDVADGDYELDFIASDNSVDRYDEVISPTAWGDMANFRANPVIPDCHDYSSVAKILGRAKSVQVTNGKLVNRVAFCMDNPMGALCYKMAKGGFINSQSVGFIPLEWTNGTSQDEPARTYTKCELLEISMVVVPANPGATVGLALKRGAIQRADLRDLADYLKHFCGEPKTEPSIQVCASDAGFHDAQLLQFARAIYDVLKRA
jgi:HK97 family phage prohead protease